MTRAQKKSLAKNLYLQGQPLADICELASISDRTLRTWRDAGGWEKIRSANTLSRPNLISAYLEQSQLIVDSAKERNEPLNSKEVDSLAKLAKSISQLENKGGLVETIAVLIAFNKWLLAVEPELARSVNQYQSKYIQEMAGKYGN